MAKKPDKKPKAKPKKMTAKEQSAQFIKTARELEVDESGEAFEKAISRLLIPKQGGKGASPSGGRNIRK